MAVIGRKKARLGFTLLELLVVFVIIGILAALAIPRFTGARNRARVGAAVADLDHFRKALAMFEVDHGDYPAAMTLANASAVLVDVNGVQYVTLTSGQNFLSGSFTYSKLSTTPTSYQLSAQALDDAQTHIYAEPDSVWQQ